MYPHKLTAMKFEYLYRLGKLYDMSFVTSTEFIIMTISAIIFWKRKNLSINVNSHFRLEYQMFQYSILNCSVSFFYYYYYLYTLTLYLHRTFLICVTTWLFRMPLCREIPFKAPPGIRYISVSSNMPRSFSLSMFTGSFKLR